MARTASKSKKAVLNEKWEQILDACRAEWLLAKYTGLDKVKHLITYAVLKYDSEVSFMSRKGWNKKRNENTISKSQDAAMSSTCVQQMLDIVSKNK